MYQDRVATQQLMTTTNLVIAEAYVSIRNTGGLKPALKLLEVVRETSFIRKIYSDAALESQAETLLKQYSDQRFSFVDAVSFVVMQQFGIAEAFAFDHHFATAGFRVLPATS